jgi:pyruvate/2-oxoacid:ferredoxin oxidoreductase beta subunit/Pyruvate/2-oxoacid:ferredoxin oxidoreductase gamma subunit
MITKHETYMTDKIGPLPFCPGCGHTMLIKALDKALVKLQLDPKKVVIVTDIGCIGLSDRYFTTCAFHGLHGRSITYACGLKLARPEMTVIALKGDGGCGIGGTHLLNVARRNIGITLIVGNNFNYGMTGGQHSVTTPTKGVTSTTPWGNVEGPMDLCGTAIAAGGSWVYRATVFEKELPDVIATAIEQPGFALLDIWELCTAHFAPRNKFRKKELLALLESLDFKTGLLADRKRPEYTEVYRAAYEEGKKVLKEAPGIDTSYPNKIDKQTGVIIAGSAGQKIRSTATTFARAAMYAGLNASQKDDYPITVLTGHSVAEVILSPETIDFTSIDSPDYFILISEDGLKRTRARIEKLPATCTLYAEESLELPPTKARVERLPLKGVDKVAITTAALAAMIEQTGIFPTDAFAEAFRAFKSAPIAEVNLKGVAAGVALAPKVG